MTKAVLLRVLPIVSVIAVSACVLLGNLGGWDLWNPDEPRYAQVAREMVESGHYIVPHLNSEPYPDKPPLYFWLVAACSRFFGDVTAVAARLPSVLSALGILVLTYVLGIRLFDSQTALLATVILFTAEQFFSVAVSVHLDMLLTLLTTGAIILLQSWYIRLPGGAPFLYAAYVCMGLALLTKGPVGLCVPLLSFFVFLSSKKEWRNLRHLRLGTGILLAAGIFALWLVPACLLGGEAYRNNILFAQTFGRMVDSYSHQNPFYYYLLEFPIDFFPWSLFIPSVCIYIWAHRDRLTEIRLPLAWFLSTFIFFSLISGKRSLYLLPLYPAAALLMAWFFTRMIREPSRPISRLVSVPFRILCVLLIGFGVVGTALFAVDIEVIRPIHHEAGIFYIICGVLVCFGVAGFVLMQRIPRAAFVPSYTAGITTVLFLLITLLVFPAINGVKSGRFFCERILKHIGPHDRLLATFEPELFNYFLHRYPIPVVEDEAALEELTSSRQKTFVLVRGRKKQLMPEGISDKIVVLEQQQIGHRYYALVGFREDPILFN